MVGGVIVGRLVLLLTASSVCWNFLCFVCYDIQYKTKASSQSNQMLNKLDKRVGPSNFVFLCETDGQTE